MMVKKIIEVLDGIETIFVAEQVPDHSGPFMTNKRERQLKVSDLPDAPEKRVVELPEGLLEKIKLVKDDDNDFVEFLDYVPFVAVADELSVKVSVAKALLADWWLHLELVEFVPKKEPKYAVETKFGYVMAVYNGYGNELGVGEFTYDEYTDDLTEKEADSMVVGLGGEKGLLMPRKVKVED